MEKFPILYQGRGIGELTVSREGEDTLFSAVCHLPDKELWCIWVVGEKESLRLGCPEGQGGKLSRRFSHRMTAPLGRLRCGELRKAVSQECGWETLRDPQRLFRTPWLWKALQEKQGVLTRMQGGCRLLALPFSPQLPFPLVSLFCFARIRKIREGTYAVFAFNGEEWPVIGKF